MSNAVKKIEPNEPVSMLSIIEKAISSPDTDISKLERLLDVQERIIAKQAEMDFNQALTRVQQGLPTINKKGMIEFTDKNGQKRETPFARYEDIDAAIRPLLLKEGFSISFNSDWGNEGAVISGTLSHSAGHKQTASMRLPLDTSGSKNNLQAMGSTISYGKRYLVGMLLNIVTKGEDDDGKKAYTPESLSENQIMIIEEWISSTESNKEAFLKTYNVEAISDIPANKYEGIIALFKKKQAKK